MQRPQTVYAVRFRLQPPKKNFMYENKKILAITLARGGSKSVPKEHKENSWKALIAFTIEEHKSKHIDDYIVSTDCKEIANVANKFGAETPF